MSRHVTEPMTEGDIIVDKISMRYNFALGIQPIVLHSNETSSDVAVASRPSRTRLRSRWSHYAP